MSWLYAAETMADHASSGRLKLVRTLKLSGDGKADPGLMSCSYQMWSWWWGVGEASVGAARCADLRSLASALQTFRPLSDLAVHYSQILLAKIPNA